MRGAVISRNSALYRDKSRCLEILNLESGPNCGLLHPYFFDFFILFLDFLHMVGVGRASELRRRDIQSNANV